MRLLEFPAGAQPPDDRSIQFIGNATILIRYRGFTILTDPTFVHKHEKVDIGYGMHTTRLTDPALDIHELPPLDFVVLSHFHGDHFDQVAEAELDKSLPILTTPQAVKELEQRGFDAAIGLDTWESARAVKGSDEVVVTSMPGRHGPGIVDFALPDVMGSVLEFGGEGGHSLYLSGDTLLFEDLEEIPRRYPGLDLGVFHLGGTRVMGVMVTMDAQMGVEALRLIDPETAIPVHFDDYDVFTSPLSDFLSAAEDAGLAGKVRTLQRGETYRF